MAAATKTRKRTRRTKAQIESAREMARDQRQREFDTTLWAWNGYAGYRACASCREVDHCRGRTYDTQQCRRCYIDGAPIRREP